MQYHWDPLGAPKGTASNLQLNVSFSPYEIILIITLTLIL